MQNTSTVGIPKNCMNWLVLGLTNLYRYGNKRCIKRAFWLI